MPPLSSEPVLCVNIQSWGLRGDHLRVAIPPPSPSQGKEHLGGGLGAQVPPQRPPPGGWTLPLCLASQGLRAVARKVGGGGWVGK